MTRIATGTVTETTKTETDLDVLFEPAGVF